MEEYGDIFEAARKASAATDGIFGYRGRDAIGLTAKVERSMDLTKLAALDGVEDMAEREKIAFGLVQSKRARLDATRRYELNEAIKWSREEFGRRFAKNSSEEIANFGRELDLIDATETDDGAKETRRGALVAAFGDAVEKAYATFYGGMKRLGAGDAEAQAAAEKAANQYATGSLEGFIMSGGSQKMQFSKEALAMYGTSEARFQPEYETDGGGRYRLDGDNRRIPMRGNDGRIVRTDTFDPAGGLWMTDGDVNRLRAGIASEERRIETARKAAAAAGEDAVLAQVYNYGAEGDEILAKSSDGLSYDESELQERIDILRDIRNTAARGGNPKVADRAAEEARRLQSKAQRMRKAALEEKAKAEKEAAQKDSFETFRRIAAGADDAAIAEGAERIVAGATTGDNDTAGVNAGGESVPPGRYLKRLADAAWSGWNDPQRAEARRILSDDEKRRNRVAFDNTERLLAEIGFRVTPEEEQSVGYVRRGMLQYSDGAATRQGTDRVFIKRDGENSGEALVPAGIQVEWRDPVVQKRGRRFLWINWETDDGGSSIGGMMKNEINGIVREIIEDVRTFGHDLYDGKHDNERRRYVKKLQDAFRREKMKKDRNAVYDAMLNAVRVESI